MRTNANMGNRFKIGISLAICTVCAVMMCFLLTACGGGGSSSGSSSKTDTSAFVDGWTATSIEQGDTSMNMQDYANLGVYITLTLNDDGTYTYAMNDGDSSTGSWTATSSTEGTIDMDGETLKMVADGDTLTLSDDADGKLVFARGISDAAAKATAATSATTSTTGSTDSTSTTGSTTSTTTTSSATSVPMDYTVADDAMATIKVTGKIYDEYMGAGYTFDITNNSDKAIYVTIPMDSSSVNGVMDDMTLGATIQPGKKSIEEVYFFDEVASIDDLKDVEASVEIWDDDTYDTLATYAFKPAD